MGYLSDIRSIARDAGEIRDKVKTFNHKSVARGALDGTLQFPCLVSNAIPIDTAATLAKTLERVYASFVQTYLSTNNTIDISVDKNPSDFLKKFHNNIKVESTIDDLYQEFCVDNDEYYDGLMERIYNGTTKAFVNESTNKMILFNISNDFNSAVYESNKEQLQESLAAIDFMPFPNIGNSPFYEAINPSRANRQVQYDQYGDITGSTTTWNDRDTFGDRALNIADKGISSAINSGLNYGINQLERKQKLADDAAKDARTHLNNLDKERYKASLSNTGVPTLLKDTDVKKQNEIQPYLMQVRLMAVNSDKEFVQFMDFIVGIKVVLHNMKSEEMIINIQNALENNSKIFKFIRWTTGEKSLFKDLLFNINDVKLDVANRSKGASPWWSKLKRLKEESNIQKSLFTKTQFVPQSTIIISSYEVDAIKARYGHNLADARFARKLMKSLFLMNFVIIDESTRTIEILYDGEKSYQTYPLETLEREVAMNSSKLSKELTRMMSK